MKFFEISDCDVTLPGGARLLSVARANAKVDVEFSRLVELGHEAREQIERLSADNARLREVLTDLVEQFEPRTRVDDQILERARAALNGGAT